MAIVTRAPSRVLVLLTVIAVASLLLLASAVQAGGPAPTIEYRVDTGDTLWEVAARVTEPGQDVRATIYEIRSLNGLDGSLIRPGQVLIVPAS